MRSIQTAAVSTFHGLAGIVVVVVVIIISVKPEGLEDYVGAILVYSILLITNYQ